MADKVTIGFKETKEVLDAAIALGQGLEKSLDDGKLNLIDIPNFISFFTLILPALDNVDQVPFEFKISNPEDIAELKAYLNEHLDLEDDQLEAFIEDAFKVTLDLFAFLKLYFLKPAEGEPKGEGTDPETDSEASTPAE